MAIKKPYPLSAKRDWYALGGKRRNNPLSATKILREKLLAELDAAESALADIDEANAAFSAGESECLGLDLDRWRAAGISRPIIPEGSRDRLVRDIHRLRARLHRLEGAK